MAGILANSVSESMVSGDTAVDNTVSGYLENEQIILSASPAGSNYTWSLTRPTASSRGALSQTSGSQVSFVPEVAGNWLVSCDVDGTEYTLVITVLAIAVARSVNAVRLLPVADNQIQNPSSGQTLYYSSTQAALTTKDSSGNLRTVNTTPV